MSEKLMLSESEDNTAVSSSTSRQSDSDEQMSARTISRENIEKIADKVYRLMQRDLMLERERSTKIGG